MVPGTLNILYVPVPISNCLFANKMANYVSTLVGENLEWGEYPTTDWYDGFMAAPNGFLYGIPCSARQVAKFNPVDKSITHIGPDFGDNTENEPQFMFGGGNHHESRWHR